MKRRTVIFGGSFSPPHLGHTGLVRYVLGQHYADALWLMPSPHNPLKARGALLPEALRLELARLAIVGIAGAGVTDIEYHLPRPSYTVDTLAALRRAYPQREFVLLIGADNYLAFGAWRRGDEILRHHRLLVYPRKGYPVCADALPPQVTLLSDAPIFPYSSTQVRQRLLWGEGVGDMLLPAVAQRLNDALLSGEITPRDLQPQSTTTQ